MPAGFWKENNIRAMSAEVSRAESDEDFAPSIERFMSDSLNVEFCDGGGWWRVSRKQQGIDTQIDLVALNISMPSIFPHFFLLVHGLIMPPVFQCFGWRSQRPMTRKKHPRIQGPWIET